MADKLHGLEANDLDDIAGGTVEISVDKTKMQKIVVDAKHSGKALDWALQFCRTEEERQYVSMIWDSLA